MGVTRIPVVSNPGGVKVSVSTGQYLHFVLGAGGPIPIFSFASSAKGVLFEAPDFPGDPLPKYEWLHLKNPSDVQQLEVLGLRLSFFSNANYTYTVELWGKGGAEKVVLQVNYTGIPTDVIEESFTVVIA